MDLSNICSGPPEKKMGIKASNTAEVDTRYVSLSSPLVRCILIMSVCLSRTSLEVSALNCVAMAMFASCFRGRGGVQGGHDDSQQRKVRHGSRTLRNNETTHQESSKH